MCAETVEETDTTHSRTATDEGHGCSAPTRKRSCRGDRRHAGAVRGERGGCDGVRSTASARRTGRRSSLRHAASVHPCYREARERARPRLAGSATSHGARPLRVNAQVAPSCPACCLHVGRSTGRRDRNSSSARAVTNERAAYRSTRRRAVHRIVSSVDCAIMRRVPGPTVGRRNRRGRAPR